LLAPLAPPEADVAVVVVVEPTLATPGDDAPPQAVPRTPRPTRAATAGPTCRRKLGLFDTAALILIKRSPLS
jgi:hypothetical protein